MKKIITIVLVLSIPLIVFADIYKWTDEQGTTHISDDLTNAPAEIQEKHAKPVESQTKKIQFKNGYIEVKENTKIFGFYIHYNDPKKRGFSGCQEEKSSNEQILRNICKDAYEQFIKTIK